jgi:hypothetical protein
MALDKFITYLTWKMRKSSTTFCYFLFKDVKIAFHQKSPEWSFCCPCVFRVSLSLTCSVQLAWLLSLTCCFQLTPCHSCSCFHWITITFSSLVSRQIVFGYISKICPALVFLIFFTVVSWSCFSQHLDFDCRSKTVSCRGTPGSVFRNL